jgi:hypothetical protein
MGFGGMPYGMMPPMSMGGGGYGGMMQVPIGLPRISYQGMQ